MPTHVYSLPAVLHKPATTEDMLRLLGDLRQVLPYASAPDLPQLLDMSVFQDSDDDTSRRGRRSRSRKHAPALPADVITLIVQQLRQLYEEEPYEGLGMSDSGGRSSWKELKRLGFINRTCERSADYELSLRRADHLTSTRRGKRLLSDVQYRVAHQGDPFVPCTCQVPPTQPQPSDRPHSSICASLVSPPYLQRTRGGWALTAYYIATSSSVS